MSRRDCGQPYDAPYEHRVVCGRLKGHGGPHGPRYCRAVVFGHGNPPGGSSCSSRPLDNSLYCKRHDPALAEARAAARPVPMWQRLALAERRVEAMKRVAQRGIEEERLRLTALHEIVSLAQGESVEQTIANIVGATPAEVTEAIKGGSNT